MPVLNEPMMNQLTASQFISTDQHEPTIPTTIIRHAEPEDSLALHQLLMEPQVIYWTIETPFTPVIQIQKRLAEPGHYCLVACAGNEIIGMVALTRYLQPRLHHVAKLGPIAIKRQWQGRGVGSQLMQMAVHLADHWLNIMRLELLVYVDNVSAIALYQKYGFVTEGTLRQLAFRQGDYVDAHIMARIQK